MGYLGLLTEFLRLRSHGNMTRASLRDLQDRRLRSLLRHAWDRSPYYRRRFEGAGITAEALSSLPLSSFPTMDKAELVANFDQILTVPEVSQEALRRFDREHGDDRGVFLDEYHIVHSSGSTGKPVFFLYDRSAWNRMLTAIIRGALWDMSLYSVAKLLLAGPRIAYLAATDGRYGGAMAVGGGVEGLRGEHLFLDVKTPLSRWVKSVEDFRPNVVIGYPSAVKILGALVEERGLDLNVCRVISCGEPLSSGLRTYLERVFRSQVINFYGAGESLALGVDTGDADGMVLFDDMNVVEVEEGAMYLTNLYNYAQPLIRYRLSDRLRFRDGRGPFSHVDVLAGRSEEILWFSDGQGRRDFIHPLAVEGFCLQGLLDFQFVKTGEAGFEMRAEVSDPALEAEVRREMIELMGEILSEKKLDYVDFSVRFVNRIMPDPGTGKKKLILSAEEALGSGF